MGRKKIPGLINRQGTWHIDKVIRGRRICESTGTSDVEEAETFLARRMEEIRQAQVYGVRPKRTFRQAATRYLNEATKASLDRDAGLLGSLDSFIGHLPLESVHMGSLQAYIEDRRRAGRKTRTINYGLQVVRHILNLCAGEWLDEYGMTWLAHAPKIKLLRQHDQKPPHPVSLEEQARLLAELPEHLANMALFKVNTGCREAEVCGLKWEWEQEIPALDTTVFLIPGENVKNRLDRLVVLNRVAKTVIEKMRGIHSEYVFTYHGRRINQMYGAAWRKARERAGLPDVRVHDLKHTFGRRLRAAGVALEDRQDLLGHKSSRITTHYSAPELENLIEAANKACGNGSRKSPALVIIKRKIRLEQPANLAD